MRALPISSTGTVVSSVRMRSAAKIWALIAGGISVAAAAATQSARVDVELDALAGEGSAR